MESRAFRLAGLGGRSRFDPIAPPSPSDCVCDSDAASSGAPPAARAVPDGACARRPRARMVRHCHVLPPHLVGRTRLPVGRHADKPLLQSGLLRQARVLHPVGRRQDDRRDRRQRPHIHLASTWSRTAGGWPTGGPSTLTSRPTS